MLNPAKLLLTVTIAYNFIEGVIGLGAGIAAGSIALIAFGADSYREFAAASLLLWRLSIADHARADAIEGRVRQFIGWTFLALAAAVVFQAAWSLTVQDGASESLLGIGLAAASITVMPVVALLKLRFAARNNVPSLAAEARETLACS